MSDATPSPCATCGHSEVVPMHTRGLGVICECGCRNYAPIPPRPVFTTSPGVSRD